MDYEKQPGEFKSLKKQKNVRFMPRNPESDARKKHLAKYLENRIGALKCPHPSRVDWYSSLDGNTHVFITDSKPHYNARPWFDMKLSDITELANYPEGFVIFVLGDEANFLVIPAAILQSEIKNYQAGLRAMEEGRYHFNLRGNTFEQLPNWNLQPFAQNWENIPKRQNPN
jgi:hypothetical protein